MLGYVVLLIILMHLGVAASRNLRLGVDFHFATNRVKDDIDMTTGYRGTFVFDVLRRVFKESH
ncbi:hypothetical protein ERO13_D13G091950v2 [Gossypium hirsutum]|uniref:Uncharacterized protein n=1 Tax=Gossypium darwinii TaxID=34276 RepID=A0A5D1ZWQ4_GOSDA|nr:hypothetical protein ERO13_D13G091950v2 [Gossypium hirsutum]TYG37021.1 hypothetical protein ES288_D13G108900v1 [Gossypium darwinii]